MKTLGQYLRELRDAKDISLREFAQMLELSATFVSDIELGKRHPSDDVLAKMGKILGVSLAQLKKHDTRPPVDEMRKITASNPGYAFAFRQVMEKKVSPEELLNLVNQKSQRRKD
ncbi:MAG: helix-turn-helix domain-containing protein [Rhodospirillales bacterium]|nr:helix-turn-helix domain-containing protein [Rhodospirillales bacterium]